MHRKSDETVMAQSAWQCGEATPAESDLPRGAGAINDDHWNCAVTPEEHNRNDTDLELSRFLPYLLVNLSKRLSTALSATYQRDYDLSVHEWRVLANLNQSGALTSKEIGEQTYMDKVKVSRAIKGLDEKGWTRKGPHPSDSRAYLVSLTAAGRRVIEKIIPRVLSWESELLQALSTQERAALMTAIHKLNARLDLLDRE